MLKVLNSAFGKIGQLTNAGRLMDATAAIQQVLATQHHVPFPSKSISRWPRTAIGETADRPDFLAGAFSAFDATARPNASSSEGLSPSAREDRLGDQFISASFTAEPGTRPYKLYIPSAHRAAKLRPLIVMLHGCTQSPDDFATGTRMNEFAERDNFLVVYPAQTSTANIQKCWNWFNKSDRARDQGESSLIAGITRKIIAEYEVDPERVYIAGMSAGGAAAAVMASTYPDIYAAVGVHSGLACGAANNMQSAFAAMRHGSCGDAPTRRVKVTPAIIFHGDQDATVNVRNGDFVAAQFAGNAIASTFAEAGSVPGGHAYQRIAAVDAAGETVSERWIIQGAGHAWAGGSASGSYTDPQGPDATKEMVRFFMQHTK